MLPIVVGWGFDHMSEYMAVMQTGLVDNQAELEARFHEATEGWTHEEKDMAAQYEWEDDFWIAHTVLPRHLHAGFVLIWYSFMEYQFFRVCRQIANDRGLEQELTKPKYRTRGMTGYRSFYVHVANRKMDEKIWSEVMKVGTIRNTLVHNGGMFDEVRQDLKPYLQRFSLLSSDGLDELRINQGFCQHIIELGRQFFTQVFDSLGWANSANGKSAI